MSYGMAPDLPVLVGVGPVRTGTSWVHELFFDHPEVSVTRVKEVNYFREHFENPVEWYFGKFQPIGPRTKLLVDMSPSGFGWPDVAPRIKRAIPNPYIMIGLRSPYERLLSFYLKFGQSYRTFPEMAEVYYHINGFGPVSARVREYAGCIGHDRVIFFPFDKLADAPDKVSRELQMRLGLHYHEAPSVRHRVNSAQPQSGSASWKLAKRGAQALARHAPGLRHTLRYRSPLGKLHAIGTSGVRSDDRMRVDEVMSTFRKCSVLFEPDIDELERMLSTDLSAWRLDAQCIKLKRERVA
jgi:hypothetical protein